MIKLKKIRLFYAFIIIFLIVFNFTGCDLTENELYNEKGTVSGSVIDINEEPILNAKVYIDEEHDFTNNEGIFEIDNISLDEHSLKITKEGYISLETKIIVEEGFNNIGEFFLSETQRPQILGVDLKKKEIDDGTEVIKTIRAYSDAPVDWVNRSFKGPLDIIYGGGSSRDFEEVEENIWESSRTYKISKYEPSGEYYFENISVRNEGRLESEIWENEVSVEIENEQEAQEPEILDIELEKNTVDDGTEVIKTIRAYSDAPVDWVSRRFEGPTGTIYGGGSSRDFEEVEENIWESRRPYNISNHEPSGQYYFEDISIRNEGRLESEIWEEEVSVIIEN